MKARLIGLACFALLGACVGVESSTPAPGGDDRQPLGKADNIGSCQTPDGDLCGGPSEGSCWCDEYCETFGDCCGDYEAVCEGDGIEPGNLCLGEGHCEDGQTCDHSECLSNCPEGGICPAVCWGQCVDAGDEPDPFPCTDGSVAICEIVPPTCPDGQVVSVQNNCFGPCVDPETCEPPVASCEELEANFAAETLDIRSCTTDAECGQVLSGTSCGCTRNWVARTDADISDWEDARSELQEAECGIGPISTCDCPFADGFACEEGICTWNYI